MIKSEAQILPGSLSVTSAGSFANGVKESSSSILIADNNLTDGYAAGMDLKDAPPSLNPNGPTGSAAFQWGTPSSSSAYPHTSALWFQPVAITNVAPDQFFNLGTLYYRNGTILTNSGASAVDIGLNLNFTNPSGLSAMNTTFTSKLINSLNSNDPIASADIVSLTNHGSMINFKDATGKQYYLELSFKVDQNTLDGTLSTLDQFKVIEGMQGRADLIGRFTTSPMALGSSINNTVTVPEPSSSLLAIFGVLVIIRRKR